MRSRKQGFHIVVSKKKNILPILKQLGPRAPSKRSGEKKNGIHRLSEMCKG